MKCVRLPDVAPKACHYLACRQSGACAAANHPPPPSPKAKPKRGKK